MIHPTRIGISVNSNGKHPATMAKTLFLLSFFFIGRAIAFFNVYRSQHGRVSIYLGQGSAVVDYSNSRLFAKKKKGKKKQNKNNKKSGFEWANSFTLKPFESTALRELAATACASFEGRTGKALCDELKGATDIPKTLWNSNSIACVVVVPDIDDDSDSPLVKYANVAALETVGLKPDEFEKFIASTTEGDKISQEVTISLPTEIKGEKSYERNYNKKIIREDEGRSSISIQNAHRWAIEKSAFLDGKFVTETVGIAYAWNSWLEGDSTVCKPGGIRELKIDVEELERTIQAQGDAIRELKEVQGFSNKDPEVAEAVQELLRLKALLESLT